MHTALLLTAATFTLGSILFSLPKNTEHIEPQTEHHTTIAQEALHRLETHYDFVWDFRNSQFPESNSFAIVRHQETFRVVDLESGEPLYPSQFDDIGRYDQHGILPVALDGEWFHVDVLSGEPLYEARYMYVSKQLDRFPGTKQISVAKNEEGVFHIHTLDGTPLYEQRYTWIDELVYASGITRAGTKHGFVYIHIHTGEPIGEAHYDDEISSLPFLPVLHRNTWHHINLETGNRVYQETYPTREEAEQVLQTISST